jgi:general secretion pathway protein G
VVLAIVGMLAAIFAPELLRWLRERKVTRAVLDIGMLQVDINAYEDFAGVLPESLDDLDREPPLDPWGRPYQYLRIEGSSRGEWRKDRFLVPLNSDYDLYSGGPDGESLPPLTAAPSRDDIVRAGDGAFIGKAIDY